MAQIPFAPFPPSPPPANTSFALGAQGNGVIPSNTAVQSIIDRPRFGSFRREVVTWRTPHLGYIQMYINPQQLVIKDRKQITAKRTKGGFVIQYAGEDLTEITLSGTTGSAGVEGINVLFSAYRAEQEAFEGISVALEEQLASVQLDSLINDFATPFNRGNLFQLADSALRNGGRPMPTLASLATQIELFFQGRLYRGYFESFQVTESAQNPGWFNYDIVFKSYAFQGLRRNFMPWHRQPFNPANSDANPLSFIATEDRINTAERSQIVPDEFEAPNLSIAGYSRFPPPNYKMGERSRRVAADNSGINISDEQLR